MFERLIIAGVLAGSLFGGGYFVYNHAKQVGYDEAQAEFDEKSRKVIKDHEAEIAKLNKIHETINTGTVASYEKKLSDLDRKYRNAGGLRITKAVCNPSGAIATAQSPAGNNEAESVRLPTDVERRLFDLARKADEVNTQLSACQGWIKANGMAD